MINKVILEGVVTKSGYGKNAELGGYFINIKPEVKSYNGFQSKKSFSAYANRPLSTMLAKAVEAEPNCHIYIEGKLNTFYDIKAKKYEMTVLIEKFTIIGPKNSKK